VTRLTVKRTLHAERAVLWRLLTVPEEMNRWSEASVTGVEPGVNGSYAEVGARRRVHVPLLAWRIRLEEEIVEVVPEERFVYRVRSGGAIRDHRGVQTLEALGAGLLELRWDVSFRAVLPGLGLGMRLLLRPRLERSLDALEGLARLSARSQPPG